LYPTKLTHCLISCDSLGPSELHRNSTFLVRRNKKLFLRSSVDTFNFSSSLTLLYLCEGRCGGTAESQHRHCTTPLLHRSFPTYQGRRCWFHLLLHLWTSSVRTGDIHPLPDTSVDDASAARATPAPIAGFWNTPPTPESPPSSQEENSP